MNIALKTKPAITHIPRSFGAINSTLFRCITKQTEDVPTHTGQVNI